MSLVCSSVFALLAITSKDLGPNCMPTQYCVTGHTKEMLLLKSSSIVMNLSMLCEF